MTLGAPTTIAQVLWHTAQQYPDRACVTDLDDPKPATVSYADLVGRVAAVAGAWRGLGLEPGDRVALLLHNSQAYVEAWLGAAAAGLIVVPLNVRLLGEDYRHMLTDSGSRVLVTTGEFLDRVPELTQLPGLRVVRADPDADGDLLLARLAAQAQPVAAPLACRGSDPASLMYTSGTTGSPKAVVLSHDSWRSVADTAARVLALGGDEVMLHVAPLTHGAGFLLLPTLQVAGHNLLCRSYDAARTWRLLAEHAVTGMFLVPSMIRMLLDTRPADSALPASLRRLYYAGSPIDPETMREATEAFEGRLVQSFAQMESPMFFTALDQHDHCRALNDPGLGIARSAGRALSGVQLRIVDDAGVAQPAGEAGEILARAPQTMPGYWGRPDDTAKTLAEGWLHTGVIDRKKDMIVTGGSNVYAREVEEVLEQVPGVQEAAVIGTPHRIWGEAVTAVLVAASDDHRDADTVLATCRERLAGYRVPKQVFWIDELPRNAYGKVIKKRLREHFATTQPEPAHAAFHHGESPARSEPSGR